MLCVHAVEARGSDEGFERLQPLAQSASFPPSSRTFLPISVSRLLFLSPVLFPRPPLLIYLPIPYNRENLSKLLTPVEVTRNCYQLGILDYDSPKATSQVSLIWAHPRVRGCRAVDGGSCTPRHLSRHRWRNRHCPSLPLPLLPYALENSSDLSFPHFPPPLCPALPKEQVKRFVPYTQLNLCGLLHLP